MKTLNLKTFSRLAAAFVALVSFNLRAAMLYVSLESPNPSPPFATWTTAATNIQQAVDAALPGDEIVVTNGVYRTGTVETNGLNRIALTNAVTVRSVNGPEVTLIEGATNGVRCAFVGDGAVLSGFTLTQGWADTGGGAACQPLGVLTNCVLTGNSAGYGGGGASGGTLRSCILTGNLATHVGGGAYDSHLRNCVLSENSAYGGGGVIFGTLYDCLVERNSADGGGGVKQSTLHACRVNENSAGVEGGGAWHSDLFDCLVIDNSAGRGGGATGGHLYNCTLSGNSADEGGAVVHSCCLGGHCYLINCVVYANQADIGPNYGSGTTFEYSCTSPLPEGFGNIDTDPRFVDAAHGDFRLLPDSPCIDAGTNLTEFLTTDILGLPRPLDGNGDGIARFDMGAYEFNPYRFEPVLRVTPNGLQFTVRGEPAKSVRIERSRNLVNWELVATVPIPVSGQTLIDPTATSEPCLFYRAVAVP